MTAIEANGIALNYEVTGAGEPVLLLHGLGSRAEDWELQVPDLARTYRVITVDFRGHGRSGKPSGPYTVALMASDILALLNTLEIQSTHIVGLSMGGMIAFQLAVDRPERVRSLMIVNSAAALVPRSFSQHWLVWQRLGLARLFGPATTGRFLSRRLFPKPEQAVFRERFVREWATNDRHAYLAAMKALIGWSVLDRIHQITCPVLVISGDRDYLPADVKLEYTRLIPDARFVVIEDSGHATPIDQSEKFNRLMLEFLAEVDARYPTAYH
jgi:3-oxoadipate enol-lactonase